MRKTIAFILLTIASIAIYDVWVIYEYGREESISAHLLSMGEVIPQLPLLLGYTFGHLTFPKKTTEEYRAKVLPYSVVGFLVVAYLMIIDIYQVYWGEGLSATIFGGREFNQSWFFISGYILGHFFWSMPKTKWSGRFKK